MEPPRNGKPRPPIMVPAGGDKLLSRGCPVTSSTKPEQGDLESITDGDKECDQSGPGYGEGPTLLKLAAGIQWLQVDLRTSQVINAVCIWRYHWVRCVYRDVVVQLSDDADFIDGVTTVFNNDHDNSARLGVGEDKEYIETNAGRPIPVPGIRARYIRAYSNGWYRPGGWLDPFNYCTEIEVYGGESTSEEKVPIKIEYPKPPFT
ncbi:MAG: discoidin domain-containing protein [Kiritimatiellaeota bacterium]|nr:discoidin domain-containing protein [Kiritimatiellota bacterium]